MRVVAFFATLLVVACSDGSAAPLPGEARGTFRAIFSGAIVDTLPGVAILAVFPAGAVIPAYYSVQLYLTPGQSPFWLTIVGDGPRPSVNSYVITPRTSPQTMPTVNAAKCVDNTVACFVEWGTRWEMSADAGRLEITKSSSAGVFGKPRGRRGDRCPRVRRPKAARLCAVRRALSSGRGAMLTELAERSRRAAGGRSAD